MGNRAEVKTGAIKGLNLAIEEVTVLTGKLTAEAKNFNKIVVRRK